MRLLLLLRLLLQQQQQLPLLRVVFLLVTTGAALSWCHMGFRDVTHSGLGCECLAAQSPEALGRRTCVGLLGLGAVSPLLVCCVCGPQHHALAVGERHGPSGRVWVWVGGCLPVSPHKPEWCVLCACVVALRVCHTPYVRREDVRPADCRRL